MAELLKKRIEWLDVAKGIGIILVVLGHAMAPVRPWIYLFHMPFFMILSGYTYKSKTSFRENLISKTKSLYIPFLFWNLLIIALRTMYGLMTQGPTVLPEKFKHFIVIVLCIDKDGKYLGATWFLASLFLISIVYKASDILLKKYKHRYFILMILFALIASVFYYYTLPYRQSRTILMLFFYSVGVLMRTYDKKISVNSYLLFALTLPAFIILGRMGISDNPHHSDISATFPYYVVIALIGTAMTYALSQIICNLGNLPIVRQCKDGLKYLGFRSIDIVIWHFIAFYFVVAYQIHLEGVPIKELFTYSNRYITTGDWWIAYFIVGMIIPLAWTWLLRQGWWGRFLKKINAIHE